MFGNTTEVLAVPSSCTGSSAPTIMSTKENDGSVTIQCGYGPSIWSNILFGAVRTNQTGQVNNYNKSGGVNAAWREFSKMPGEQRSVGKGNYIKSHGGK